MAGKFNITSLYGAIGRSEVWDMKSGDVVRIEYEMWAKETDELIDTTKEDLAVEKGIYDPKNIYKPLALIVGSGKLLKPLEDDMLEAEVGEERTVEIPPSEAYGERDPNLVEFFPTQRILSLPEFRDRDNYPEPGMEVTVRGKKGRIIKVTSSRVVVDFNHPLAGKTIVYKYKIVGKAEEPEEIVRWVIEAEYGKEADFVVKVDGKTVDITLPDVCKYDDRWFLAKFGIVGDLRDSLGFETIRFIEEYVKKKEEKEGEREEGEKAEGSEAEKETGETADAGQEKKASSGKKKSSKTSESKKSEKGEESRAGTGEKASDEEKSSHSGKKKSGEKSGGGKKSGGTKKKPGGRSKGSRSGDKGKSE